MNSAVSEIITTQEYQNPAAVIDTTLPKLSRPEVEAGLSTAPLGASEVFHPALRQPPPPRQLIELMLRVQEFVLQRSIRVSEFFRVSFLQLYSKYEIL